MNNELFELEEKTSSMYNAYADYYYVLDEDDEISGEEMNIMLWIEAMRLEKEYGVPFDRDYLPKVEPIVKLLAWYSVHSEDNWRI